MSVSRRTHWRAGSRGWSGSSGASGGACPVADLRVRLQEAVAVRADADPEVGARPRKRGDAAEEARAFWDRVMVEVAGSLSRLGGGPTDPGELLRSLTEKTWTEAAALGDFTAGVLAKICDAGYEGPMMAVAVARTGKWTLEILRRCDRHRFVVLPKRWIVDRTLAWTTNDTPAQQKPSCASL